MASVQIYNSRGTKYVRIVESYRDPVTKKPKTKTIKNLGRKDVLEKEDPNIIEKLKKELQDGRDSQANIQRQEVRNYLTEILDTKAAQSAKLQNYGYLVYRKLWKELNLDYFFDYRQKAETKIDFPTKEVAFNLSILRLLQPSSKLRAYENQDKLFGIKEVELHQMYRALDFFFHQKENLLKFLHKKISDMTYRNLTVCFYDVTTIYFESVEQSALKRFGYSKDNKVNTVQVVLGLLIDTNGIPVYYDLFPGNTGDFRTLEPILEKLKKDFNVKRMILVADRGLNSKRNLAILRKHGYDYIMAYKIRTATKEVKNMVIDKSTYTKLNDDLSIKETTLLQLVDLDGVKEEFTDRFILTYSAKRAEKDKSDRMRLLEKAVKLSESKSRMKSELKKGGKKYIQLSLDDIDFELNTEKIEDDGLYDGFYGIVCSDSNIESNDILRAYKGLWKIEESFRVLKSNLEARPMYVWTESSIEGHIVLCFLSLTIQRLLEYLLKKENINLSTQEIQESIKSAKLSMISNENTNYYLKNESDENFELILKALKLKDIPSVGRETQIKL